METFIALTPGTRLMAPMASRPRIVRAFIRADETDEDVDDQDVAGAPETDAHETGAAQNGEDPSGAGPAVTGQIVAEEDPIDADFDEPTYLRAFPDIAEAVRRGMLASGLAHFRGTGRAELRLQKPEYRALRETYAGPAPPQVAVDALTLSPSGSTLMTGWSDDRFDRLTEINLATRADTRHNWLAFPRLVRTDVDRNLDASPGHRFGFLLVAAPVGGASAPAIDARAANAPTFHFASGVEAKLLREPVVASDRDLRDLALAALTTASAGELDLEVTFRILDQHVGAQIAAINRLIVEQTRARRMIERRGPSRARYRGSVITTLRGGADQIVPRLALVGGGPGAGEYEFIVVVTNPDQFELALRAARMAAATLDLSLTLVLQPGGDAAGTGEDAAADLARSDRLIFMDQSVLPRDPDWAARHTTLLDNAPALQTRLFGGLSRRPDGRLSHGGYYFEQETCFVPRQNDIPQPITTINLKTVTHPVGRNLPPAHEVSGISASFMSIDRAWFEALHGFTRQYCRAAHEDIDFCLRSRRQGVPAWMHPLPFWQFERRQSARADPSKGGTILNNWLLHRQWDSMIVPDLLGPPRT
jgi:hypothetical protein